MNGLDLFSGIGGISKALEPWVRTVAYCENDRYCQAVLLSRMSTGDLDNGPIWDDIRTLRRNNLPEIDIIFGGFPCQDISCAGRGKGLEGERSGLFFEIVRLVSELRPRFVFLENVPAITSRGLDRVLGEMVTLGYDTRHGVLSAKEVGALHKRERWFLLAHPNKVRLSTQQVRKVGKLGEEVCGEKEAGDKPTICPSSCGSDDTNSERKRWNEGVWEDIRPKEQVSRESNATDICETIPNSSSERLQGCGDIREPNETIREKKKSFPCFDSDTQEWQEIVSSMGKCSDGVPDYMARIRALGNSVVPLQVREAFKLLIGLPNN